MYWYRIFLSGDDLESMRSIDLVKEVGRRSAQAGYPMDFALFCVADGRYTGATYYLPPSAVKVCPGILMDFNAVPDEIPTKTSLSIAVGEDTAVDHWFKGRELLNTTDAKLTYKPKLALARSVLN